MFLAFKPRVQHVQRHLIAFLGSGDCDKTFVAVILGLIDLDNAAAQLTYFVNLGTSFADDRTNHIVGDINLLCQGLTRHDTLHRLGRGTWMANLRARMMRRSCDHWWLMWTCSSIASSAR